MGNNPIGDISRFSKMVEILEKHNLLDIIQKKGFVSLATMKFIIPTLLDIKRSDVVKELVDCELLTEDEIRLIDDYNKNKEKDKMEDNSVERKIQYSRSLYKKMLEILKKHDLMNLVDEYYDHPKNLNKHIYDMLSVSYNRTDVIKELVDCGFFNKDGMSLIDNYSKNKEEDRIDKNSLNESFKEKENIPSEDEEPLLIVLYKKLCKSAKEYIESNPDLIEIFEKEVHSPSYEVLRYTEDLGKNKGINIDKIINKKVSLAIIHQYCSMGSEWNKHLYRTEIIMNNMTDVLYELIKRKIITRGNRECVLMLKTMISYNSIDMFDYLWETLDLNVNMFDDFDKFDIIKHTISIPSIHNRSMLNRVLHNGFYVPNRYLPDFIAILKRFMEFEDNESMMLFKKIAAKETVDLMLYIIKKMKSEDLVK